MENKGAIGKAGDILRLSYFELLSPDPVKLPGAGAITAPTLREISAIGYDTYQNYLAFLLMDVETYFTMTGLGETYKALSEAEKDQLHIFDLLLLNEAATALLENALDFFLKETVRYSPEELCFTVRADGRDTGRITKENYSRVCGCILLRSCIRTDQREDLSNVKSKKALEIMKKLRKGRQEQSRQAKADKNLELANILSAVANRSPSLNILTIWDLTVFQLWDCFSRLTNNSIYDIQSMSVAAWGNKDHSFDAAAWFRRLDANGGNPV